MSARGVAFVFVAFVAPLAGCILLVSPRDYGKACRFTGRESACGTCVRAHCQASVDACCGDDACDPSLELLDSCAGGDPKGCRFLAIDEESSTATRGALARCVADQCRSECALGSTKSQTKCDLPLFSKGMTCTCTVSAESNDTVCSRAALPNTICCAAASWPGPALRCSCLTLGCSASATGDGCLCGLFDSSSTEHSCTLKHCCARADTCACSSEPCAPSDTPVPTCDLSAVKCGAGLKVVESCSISTAGP